MLLDKDIREPLFSFLEMKYGKNRILEEKNMGRSRADIVMVLPGKVWGIEIKSDADTYARLKSQTKDYDTYFDANIIVVGSSHGNHVEEHVPEHWGIITVEPVEDVPDFYMLREPKPNPKITLAKKLEILWRPELAKLQELHDMPKYEYLSKKNLIQKFVERASYPSEKKGFLEETVLKEEISELLFERDYSQIRDQINAFRAEKGLHKRKRRRYKRRRKTAEL